MTTMCGYHSSAGHMVLNKASMILIFIEFIFSAVGGMKAGLEAGIRS